MKKIEKLNDPYKKFCVPKCEECVKISKNVTLIKDFFQNFEYARDFFINRDKWECIQYQNHDKPGYESIFPDWVGKSLMEKYVIDNKLITGSYYATCNFNYQDSSPIFSLSNSNYFPHVDEIGNEYSRKYICLINMNYNPISTNFYSYNNKECCSEELKNDWDNYGEKISTEMLNFYQKSIINRSEVKEFLDKKNNMDIKLINKIEYDSNQAIIYPANAFHCADITENFTLVNPRFILRIIFEVKNSNIKTLNYR